MKHLYKRRKQGFTLVECVIAIAVFAIMTMLVASLITAAISTHRQNLMEMRSIREQRRVLTQTQGVFADKIGTDSKAKDVIKERDADKTTLVFDFGKDSAGNDIVVRYDFQARVVEDDVLTSKDITRRGMEMTGFQVDEATKGRFDLPVVVAVGFDAADIQLSTRDKSELGLPDITGPLHGTGASDKWEKVHDTLDSYCYKLKKLTMIAASDTFGGGGNEGDVFKDVYYTGQGAMNVERDVYGFFIGAGHKEIDPNAATTDYYAHILKVTAKGNAIKRNPGASEATLSFRFPEGTVEGIIVKNVLIKGHSGSVLEPLSDASYISGFSDKTLKGKKYDVFTITIPDGINYFPDIYLAIIKTEAHDNIRTGLLGLVKK